jgi:maltooligosyltrehalose trehalohydrolase
MGTPRLLPVGAEVREGAVGFRVWAPKHQRVEVVIESGRAKGAHSLEAERDGYFSNAVFGAAVGDLYRFRLSGEEKLYPDPASRFQPDGPHGPSQVVDPIAFQWSDSHWRGVALRGQVLYEIHIGTFTREGTWDAAARELPELAAVGITVVEVMPVAEFSGRFGWGYDGVNLFAPTQLYGTPDDFRRFIDIAHANNLGVILDVVYNHFGPDGNYLPQFGPYLSAKHKNEWGDNINFDGPSSGPVREYFAANAEYWVSEFHLDGLRLDATQAIVDDSPEHILVEVGRRVRAAARGRDTIIVNENEPQCAKMVRPVDKGGYELDGLWNDDFHHSAMVALTGRNEAYYSDHLGAPQEFISAAKYGYLFQGQRYSWQEQRRGTPSFDLAPWRFVTFIQNHDQVANSGRGLRCRQLTSPGRYRAMTALSLLFPGTPMLFQGQEFAASTAFHYFADHNPDLAKLVRAGRAEFMTQFRSLDRPDLAAWIPDPSDPATFDRCKLDFTQREKHAREYQMHKDLLRLRREDPAFQQKDKRWVDGAVLGPHAFVLRYFEGAPDGTKDRLLLVNFGRDLCLDQTPEPLLAAPEGRGWAVLWSSESPDYGGDGTPPPEAVDGWRVMGEAAIVLAPELLPPVDRGAASKAAQMRAKERKRRERTRLEE